LDLLVNANELLEVAVLWLKRIANVINFSLEIPTFE
jgi:hypothetical protein